ncbi:MAG: hypothetical protein QOJ12_3380 [Thermoleophilales bacterium]|nr:hypothetical protein [Thermoleophilales bacterium]
MSAVEQRFASLQPRLRTETGRTGTQAIVGLPSIDLGPRFVARNDLASLETRWLYLLLALADPRARVAIVTSDRVPEWEVEYWLGLIPGAECPRERLLMLAAGDLSNRPLAVKLLEQPSLLALLAEFARGADRSFVVPFNATEADRDVALAIDVPIRGIDHRFARYGTKSGARALFRDEGVAMPDGVEDVREAAGVAAALVRLGGRAAVVKLDRGVTGDGNTIVSPGERSPLTDAELLGGAVVEELVTGAEVHSPSVQVRLHGDGRHEVIATHDQVLDGQRYVACRFPASPSYAPAIAAEAEKVARRLAHEGAVGRFAVDFVVARDHASEAWRPYAVEINLREGATTHPLGVLEGLTDAERHYFATDSLRTTPTDARGAVAVAAERGLAWDASTATGVVFFMLRALERDGRVGIVAIGLDREHADELRRRTVELLAELARAPA